jgi:3-dehydroquinate dehydratase-2
MTGSSRTVLVLNGANLGQLGTREPSIYGNTSYAELSALCGQAGAELGLDVEVRQTDSEAELLSWLHEAAGNGVPVLLNAGAWTHTSLAIGDACAMLKAPLLEVHLSNVYRREPVRHQSHISPHAVGVIAGLGPQGYVLALSWFAATLDASDASD